MSISGVTPLSSNSAEKAAPSPQLTEFIAPGGADSSPFCGGNQASCVGGRIELRGQHQPGSLVCHSPRVLEGPRSWRQKPQVQGWRLKAPSVEEPTGHHWPNNNSWVLLLFLACPLCARCCPKFLTNISLFSSLKPTKKLLPFNL